LTVEAEIDSNDILEMKKNNLIAILFFVYPFVGFNQNIVSRSIPSVSAAVIPSLPGELSVFFQQSKIQSEFELNEEINPIYLRGYFNGDKKADYALAVIERKTGKKGILILHGRTENFFLIGAGKAISESLGDDFSWMNAWEVYEKAQPSLGVGETRMIKLKSEAILIQKREASSGLIYWDGIKYQWYQQGD
jgi:hypothetical protein